MKKSLVLAMAMALGVTASAYAANPFSDVPAGHWAYDSISKLAAAGIIEGYGDDTFRGDRLMTRYEMAQIVAKALAKGANVDKLAAEFADELDALGVRVAALEKKSDNVKITGQIRWNYEDQKRTYANGDPDKKRSRNRLRTRLWFDGKVNDNWTYRARLENVQVFHDWTGTKDNVGEDGNTNLNQAYLTGRLGGVKVTAGRYSEYLGDGNIFDDKFDGIRIGYGKNIRFGAYYGKPTGHQDSGYAGADLKKAYGANLGFDLGKKATLDLAYDRFESDGVNGLTAKADEKFGVFSANLYGKFSDKFGLGLLYMHSNGDNTDYIAENASKNGFVVTANVAGANYNKPGSWGFAAKYYHAPAGTAIAHTLVGGSPMDFTSEGYKGYSLSADYTIAKGMKYGITWSDLKGRESNNKTKVLWNEFQLRF
ncbi:MAG: S-layer homology domain-containing protein [Acidaminococcaceae bacterium]|nr:S-layer homology domain-containing protein [Acidaminococcaceae bacterium]